MFIVLIFFVVLAFILFNNYYEQSKVETFPYYRNPWYPYMSRRYDPYMYDYVRPYYFSGCVQNLFGGISCGPFSFLYY